MSLSFWNSINQGSSSTSKAAPPDLEAKREAARREQAARQAERDARLKASMESATRDMEAAKKRRSEAQETATIKKALGNDKVPLSREERRRLAIFQEDESDARPSKRRPAPSSSRKASSSSAKFKFGAAPALVALEGRRDRRTIEEVEWDLKQRRAQVAAQSGHRDSPEPAGAASSTSTKSKIGMGSSLGKMGSFKTGGSSKSASSAKPMASTSSSSKAPVKGQSNGSSVSNGKSTQKPSQTSASSSKTAGPSSAKRKRAIASDDSEENAPRRSKGKGKASSRPMEDRWEPPEEDEVDRDYIWKLMGVNRGRASARPAYSDSEEEDSDDNMEAGIDEVLAEERMAERMAAKEEKREAERLRKHAEEKKKRLGR